MIGLKKVLFILLLGLLVGCTQYKDGKPVEDDEKKQESVEEDSETAQADVDEEEVVEDDSEPVKEGKDPVIELDIEMVFGEFTMSFEQLEIEDDKAILTYRWLNQAGDGEKFFFELAGIDVKQDENLLDEVSGAYDADNKNTSDMYFPNAENGETKVTLEYEIADSETPIEITVVPYNEFDDSQTIEIDIN